MAKVAMNLAGPNELELKIKTLEKEKQDLVDKHRQAMYEKDNKIRLQSLAIEQLRFDIKKMYLENESVALKDKLVMAESALKAKNERSFWQRVFNR